MRLCKPLNYKAAGTVEFLLDLDRQEFFFIEVNPRIQVEHTVTEVVTGIDLVKAQILVSQGYKLHEEPLHIRSKKTSAPTATPFSAASLPKTPKTSSSLTTAESPPIDHRADFRFGLDGGNGFGGAVITPYFDSLLVKLTTGGSTFDETIKRTDRALREFRVRGVKTNIPFLENLIKHPTFEKGEATTTFIDNTPELFSLPRSSRSCDENSYLLGRCDRERSTRNQGQI